MVGSVSVKVCSVMVGAGKSKLRLLLCEEKTRGQIESIRSVLAKTIQEKCAGIGGRKWDLQSAHGKILGALGWCIVSDKE